MKETKIKIIIVTMTIAVIGLIAVQIFWINHAVNIEKIRFESNVNEALRKVVQKADKLETASVVIETIVPAKNKLFVIKDDSTETRALTWNSDKLLGLRKLPPKDYTFNLEINDRSSTENVHIITGINVDSTGTYENIFFEKGEVDSFVINKSKLVNTVVDELITRRRESVTFDNFSESLLDSLLTNELENKGISTEFHFGISNGKDRFRYFNSRADSIELVTSEHRVQLNPDDIFHEANFLSVYFPDKNIFIVKSLAAVLGISALLIIIIIAVFYKTLQMLLKQKRLTEIKNDLINNITHEFKTPISTISLACEALNEPVLLEKPSSISRYSSIISVENRRLSHLVENLLNTAAIEKDEFKLNKAEWEVHKIIKEVVENFRIKFEQNDVNVEINLNAERSLIYADKFHITNCINNLIDNAFKYSKENPEIKIKTESDAEMISIEISDNGIGIKKQELNRIFETFYRVSTGNLHDVKGNGIGLSYVKKMIEVHGGNVSVKSKINEGSKFTIRLPYE